LRTGKTSYSHCLSEASYGVHGKYVFSTSEAKKQETKKNMFFFFGYFFLFIQKEKSNSLALASETRRIL